MLYITMPNNHKPQEGIQEHEEREDYRPSDSNNFVTSYSSAVAGTMTAAVVNYQSGSVIGAVNGYTIIFSDFNKDNIIKKE